MCPHCGAPPEVALAKRIQKGNEPLPEVLDEAIRAASMWPEGDLTDHQLSNIEQINLDDRFFKTYFETYSLFSKLWDSRHVQLAKYTVFDEESESEVENLEILHPDLEIQENQGKPRDP